MRWTAILILIGGLTLGGLAVWQVLRPNPAVAPAPASSSDSSTNEPAPASASTSMRLYAQEIEGVPDDFTFSLEVPTGWRAEVVPAIEAINIFDPTAAGDSNLEKSQLFIRHFSANTFLTLQTVTIHEQSDLTIDGQPARRYDIEKKAGVANFPNQPTWRSARHIVTDVRVSDDNPSTFYVIAQNPTLDTTVYQHALETLKVIDDPQENTTGLLPPTAEFEARITKKQFGTYVTPENSPVSPERFTGYHTGVDVEFGDVGDEIPVRAIADGTVRLAKTAQGYGGVAVITHTVDGTERAVLYGHLDPESLPTTDTSVIQGQVIGRLGAGRTDETDGERKHLHFAIRTDTSLLLLGYVQRESDLAGWTDPLSLHFSAQ